MSEPLWKINSVVLRGSSRCRLDGVTCSIGAGVTAILGNSGAGKTSLLNLLAEMEKPDSGTVLRLFTAGSDALPLYWAPQGGGLWPHLTAHQHLAEIAKDQDCADRILSQFDLTDRQSAFPAELSQGERARLSVARALVLPVHVLLFDEPLVHVDAEHKAVGWQTIRKTTAESGTHLVLTTHEPEIVLREADFVICLRDGRVAWEGPVWQLYYAPPDEASGRFLGPLNWFDVSEQQRWFPPEERHHQSRCLRPERLLLEVASGRPGVCEVVDTKFMGSYAETTVSFTDGGASKTVVHRPAEILQVGDLVVLKSIPGCLRSKVQHG